MDYKKKLAHLFSRGTYLFFNTSMLYHFGDMWIYFNTSHYVQKICT